MENINGTNKEFTTAFVNDLQNFLKEHDEKITGNEVVQLLKNVELLKVVEEKKPTETPAPETPAPAPIIPAPEIPALKNTTIKQ